MEATVAEIRAMAQSAGAAELEVLERALVADSRKGVRAALETARRRIDAEAAERARIEALFEFDRVQIDMACAGESTNRGLLVGLDEVGRGSVAGPLAVGAVVFPEDCFVAELNDSKQLTPEAREVIASEVKQRALAWTVFYVEPESIDSKGMSASLRAAFTGALECIEATGLKVSVVLIDGNPLGIDEREHNVVKGDAKSASIAAASVIAKVDRDTLMRELDSTYPQYEFFHNKGYASQPHIDAIKEYGLSPVHRKSFCKSFMQESLF